MRIGVLTSGGDAPGMNAALRTVVNVGRARGHEVIGYLRGYDGLLDRESRPLSLGDVEGISRLGGTVIGTGRCKRMMTAAGVDAAAESLIAEKLEALVVMGGNGSLTGAHLIAQKTTACRIVGVPASIDNDVGHSGLSIGVDTAVNTIVEACDRISDTARAHRRAFVVEVMGRHSGYLAMRAGLAAEADAILYSERGMSPEEAVEKLKAMLVSSFDPARDKSRVLIVKAEGVQLPVHALVKELQAHLDAHVPGVDIRETVLGHVVRGGTPSALDRVIAQRLGYASVLVAESGAHGVMCGWDVPGGHGKATGDNSVRISTLADVLEETARLLDGTSPVTRARVALLSRVEALLAV